MPVSKNRGLALCTVGRAGTSKNIENVMVSGALGHQVSPGMAVPWRFQEPLDVKLALERWCWGPSDVKLALDGFGNRFKVGSGTGFRDFGPSRPVPSPRTPVRISA